VSTAQDSSRVTLTAADGAVASYDTAPPPDEFGLVLVRRGGYAVGLVRGADLAASKCGTRYVQGRTKAGGQSQKRYARRRANQADDVAAAAAGAVDRVLADTPNVTVFCGGDRELVKQALGGARVPVQRAERWLDVKEPRRVALERSVQQARSVLVRLNGLA